MNQTLIPPEAPPSVPPLSASQRLQAKVSEIKKAKDEENEQRNKDPVYLASKALQADQNKLKTEAANFQRRSKLTAIADLLMVLKSIWQFIPTRTMECLKTNGADGLTL